MLLLLGWFFLLGWLWAKELQKPREKKIIFHNETAGYKIYEDGVINVYNRDRYNSFYEKNTLHYN